MNSLLKRSKESDIVIFQTDKSGRFSVDTPDNYKLASIPHTEGDEGISKKEYVDLEKIINAHSSMWTRILNLGKDKKDKDRFRSNMITRNSPYAPLYTLRKDHKKYDNENDGPPVRPVCGADSTYNYKLSHLITKVLERVIYEENTTCESTEEILAEFNSLNTQGVCEGFVLGSADVKALYPSLDIPFTVEIVGEMFFKSNVMIENEDYEEAGLYVALNKTEVEINSLYIKDWCPKRKNKRGPRLKITGNGVILEKEERFKPWQKPIAVIDDVAKKRMVTECIKIALNTLLQNHVYIFDGELRKQKKGGPIGVKLTGIVAKIFMSWWSKQFSDKLKSLDIEQMLHKCYVDDINFGIKATKIGIRYVNGEIQEDEAAKTEDELMKDDERTMNLVKTIGNSIHPSIQLEIDYPSKNEDKKMPLLDIKVWVEEIDGRRVIMHEYYSKEVSSRMMVHASSAMSMKTKRVIITQEILRVLLNCSKLLSWEITTKHINEMLKRVQYSGYSKKFRFEVVKSALNGYEKIVEAENNQERPMYRPKKWNRIIREKQKHKERNTKNWIKKAGYDTAIFVPATPKSELQKQLQGKIDKTNIKIKVIEKTGLSIKRKLQKSDPFRKNKCERTDCFVCISGGKGKCDKNEIKYNIQCLGEEESCKGIYHGESADNAYTRGKDHLRDLEGERNSRLIKHCIDKHEGVIQNFKMNVDTSFKGDATLRQIFEGISINNTPNEHLINDRSEWNQPRIPRTNINI